MPDSFAEFVTATSPALHRFAYVLCGNRHLAEDLVQDALVRIHRHWPRIENGNPGGYARTAIVRAHLSWRRRRASTESVQADPTRGAAPLAGDLASGVALRAEIWELLATLPRAQRAVLVLRFYEDLDDTRIAEVLGCKPVTVRVHASRATAALRARLSDHHPQPQRSAP